MKKTFQSPYFKWGLTAFLVIFFSICFFFSIFKMNGLFSALKNFVGILKPFIYGAVVAYFVLPIYNMLVKKLLPHSKKLFKSEKKAISWTKMICSIISVFILIAVISAILSMVLPELATSILGLSSAMPDYLTELSSWLKVTLRDNQMLQHNLMEIYSKISDWIVTFIQNDTLPKLIQIMGGSLLGTVNMLKNVVVGIIIAIYILYSKDLFSAQAKKLIYSIFSTERATLLVKNTRFVHKVFGGFITGKLLDSLIIGIITFVVMTILKMPYIVLISVVIGVTNFIPFFGPFIGAIPCSLLVLMIDPIQCVYFVIFIFILQQFDGNILGPKILGDSTGLSSFWVMFAILIAGGLFGFVGMLIGVPLFAVFYSLIASLVNRSLAERNLPVKTCDYFSMDYIDSETKKPVPFKNEKPSEETGISLKKNHKFHIHRNHDDNNNNKNG